MLSFADRLRSDGVDAWIDRYELAPEGGWTLWMQRQVEKADFLLVVCMETYKRRFEGNEEPGKGRGVSWESRLARHIEYRGTVAPRSSPSIEHPVY